MIKIENIKYLFTQVDLFKMPEVIEIILVFKIGQAKCGKVSWRTDFQFLFLNSRGLVWHQEVGHIIAEKGMPCWL